MIRAHIHRLFQFAAVVTVGLVLSLMGQALAASANSELGTWKMDPAKSKTNNKSVINTVEATGEGVKVTVEVGRTDGSVTKYYYIANFDGKVNPIVGQSASGDEVAAMRIDANTVRYAFNRAGKVAGSQTVVVSADGKMRTQTFMNANGEPGMVQVYDKQ